MCEGMSAGAVLSVSDLLPEIIEATPPAHREANPIDLSEFIRRMHLRWRKHDNTANEPLVKTWRMIAEVFNRKIAEVGTEDEPKTHVLPPKPGNGKTESAIVGGAMLGADGEHRCLIVVRLIRNAERVAAEINAEAGREVAVAKHSESELTCEALAEWPVAVVCHQAYTKAMQLNGRGQPSNWSKLIAFDGTDVPEDVFRLGIMPLWCEIDINALETIGDGPAKEGFVIVHLLSNCN